MKSARTSTTRRAGLLLFLLATAFAPTQAHSQPLYKPYSFTTLSDHAGQPILFNEPQATAVAPNGDILVANTAGNTIMVVTPSGVVSTLAGSGIQGTNDGPGATASFYYPFGLSPGPGGTVFVADTWNHTIRKVASDGTVTTIAGIPNSPGTNDGPGTTARFRYPGDVKVDQATNVYVSDGGNHTVRKLQPDGPNWTVTTLVGCPTSPGSADGTNDTARFNFPYGLTLDSATNIYVADVWNHLIRKVTPDGVVTTVAGDGNEGSLDGPALAAEFDQPYAVAIDPTGALYVADSGSAIIRKITPAGVKTLGGVPYQSGYRDSWGGNAWFNTPFGVAVDAAGAIYVADVYNNTIRKGLRALSFEPPTNALSISNALFQLRLDGPPGSNAVLETSTDLRTWTPFQTNTLEEESLLVSITQTTNQNQFFRAYLTP